MFGHERKCYIAPIVSDYCRVNPKSNCLNNYARILPKFIVPFHAIGFIRNLGMRGGEAKLDREITHAENYDLDRTARFPDEEVH